MSETILERILAHKRIEVQRQQAKIPLDVLQERILRAPPVRNFAAALRSTPTTALIAEVKKASPSRGVLLTNFDHLALARTYVANGAAAISVLTDHNRSVSGLRSASLWRRRNLVDRSCSR